jgi:GTP cyclohydrolase II
MIFPVQRTSESAPTPVEVCSVVIPTPYGEFQTRVFETAGGHLYLALVCGDVTGDSPVLTRLHSECLTGDALGSLRCDCGVQLRTAMRTVAAEGRGVVLYLTGHEGRGIGLVNKLRAYVEQDHGADTVDANLRLGLPADRREYGNAAAVLTALGISTVRLMSNNPDKVDGLRRGGVQVETMVSLPTSAHHRNADYLATKAARMGHIDPTGSELVALPAAPVDVRSLLGEVNPREDRPYVVLKYTTTVDGRIAVRDADAKDVDESERRVSHALRAACDAVLVGSGTVRRTDPPLTVRLVAGATPLRVVLDTRLRIPPTAKVFADDAATMVFTTAGADEKRMAELRAAGVGVREIAAGPGGVDMAAVLMELRRIGVRSLMVEGGTMVIGSLLAAGLVDRLVVAMSPIVVDAGTQAVSLGRVTHGVRLTNRCAYLAGEDVLLGWDVERD